MSIVRIDLFAKMLGQLIWFCLMSGPFLTTCGFPHGVIRLSVFLFLLFSLQTLSKREKETKRRKETKSRKETKRGKETKEEKET